MASTISISSKSRSLVVFFALAFGISWVVWIPTALASYGLMPFQIDSTLSGLFGAFGPFFAALVTTAIYEGRAGFSTLFNRLLIWRVGIQWYLFVLLWPTILLLAKLSIAVVLGSAVPDFSQPPFVQLYPLPPELSNTTPFIVFLPFVFLQQMLIGSSMGEEPGWRGYALPRMQAHQSSLRASLLLGFLWGVWHFPLWLTKGHPMQDIFLGWSVLELMATTVLFTWVYNHTKGSLLLALLFHTSIAITGLFLASAETHPLIDVTIGWGVAILVIAVFGPKLRRSQNSWPSTWAVLRVSHRTKSWRITELRRPHILVGMLLALAISAPVTIAIGCNLHELTHLTVSRTMGLEILWVQWCLPGSGGEVKLAEISPPLQAYAGGLGAAVVLALTYVSLFMRLRLPYRSPVWYGVGVPILPLAAVQFLVGILEGTSLRNYGGDYGAMIAARPALFVPLIVGTIIGGLVLYLSHWRQIFHES